MGQHELYTTLRARGFLPAAALGYAASVVLLAGAYGRGTGALSFGMALTVVVALGWFLTDPRGSTLAGVASTLFGVAYVPLLAAHIVLLRGAPEGARLTIVVLLVVVAYDVGAYASGSAFGRHRLAPSVSPAKTWEGAFGATVAAVVAGLAGGPSIGHLDAGASLALAAAVAVAAPLGDLAESLLKRDLGIKDFGAFLPGHGGLLDRLDALLFAVPASYWLLRAVS